MKCLEERKKQKRLIKMSLQKTFLLAVELLRKDLITQLTVLLLSYLRKDFFHDIAVGHEFLTKGLYYTVLLLNYLQRTFLHRFELL